MIRLRDKESGAELGEITKEQLQFLIDQLEEESETDVDYYFSIATIEMLEQKGADFALTDLLRRAIGDGEGVEIEWLEE